MIKNGRKVDIHNILSFDVSKLPQAKLHDYTGGQGDELDFAFAQNIPVRAKVPVKDGRSQNVSFTLEYLVKFIFKI